MSVSIKTKATFKAPRLNLTSELAYIANRIIIKDIKNNMLQKKQLNGMPYPPRSASYEKWKRKEVGHNTPMLLWDKLRNALASRAVGTQKRQVYIRPIKSSNRADTTTRDKVGRYLQESGNEWFGISPAAEAKALTYMRRQIRKLLNG